MKDSVQTAAVVMAGIAVSLGLLLALVASVDAYRRWNTVQWTHTCENVHAHYEESELGCVK